MRFALIHEPPKNIYKKRIYAYNNGNRSQPNWFGRSEFNHLNLAALDSSKTPYYQKDKNSLKAKKDFNHHSKYGPEKDFLAHQNIPKDGDKYEEKNNETQLKNRFAQALAKKKIARNLKRELRPKIEPQKSILFKRRDPNAAGKQRKINLMSDSDLINDDRKHDSQSMENTADIEERQGNDHPLKMQKDQNYHSPHPKPKIYNIQLHITKPRAVVDQEKKLIMLFHPPDHEKRRQKKYYTVKTAIGTYVDPVPMVPQGKTVSKKSRRKKSKRPTAKLLKARYSPEIFLSKTNLQGKNSVIWEIRKTVLESSHSLKAGMKGTETKDPIKPNNSSQLTPSSEDFNSGDQRSSLKSEDRLKMKSEKTSQTIAKDDNQAFTPSSKSSLKFNIPAVPERHKLHSNYSLKTGKKKLIVANVGNFLTSTSKAVQKDLKQVVPETDKRKSTASRQHEPLGRTSFLKTKRDAKSRRLLKHYHREHKGAPYDGRPWIEPVGAHHVPSVANKLSIEQRHGKTTSSLENPINQVDKVENEHVKLKLKNPKVKLSVDALNDWYKKLRRLDQQDSSQKMEISLSQLSVMISDSSNAILSRKRGQNDKFQIDDDWNDNYKKSDTISQRSRYTNHSITFVRRFQESHGIQEKEDEMRKKYGIVDMTDTTNMTDMTDMTNEERPINEELIPEILDSSPTIEQLKDRLNKLTMEADGQPIKKKRKVTSQPSTGPKKYFSKINGRVEKLGKKFNARVEVEMKQQASDFGQSKCMCPTCQLFGLGKIEADPPLIKQMKAQQQRQQLKGYYRLLIQREAFICQPLTQTVNKCCCPHLPPYIACS